jgi:hypothetical protein
VTPFGRETLADDLRRGIAALVVTAQDPPNTRRWALLDRIGAGAIYAAVVVLYISLVLYIWRSVSK